MSKIISIIISICLTISYLFIPSYFYHYWQEIELAILLIALATLVIFSVIEFPRSNKIIKAPMKNNVSPTDGATYCVAVFLPLLFRRIKEIGRAPYGTEQYLLSLILFFYAVLSKYWRHNLGGRW